MKQRVAIVCALLAMLGAFSLSSAIAGGRDAVTSTPDERAIVDEIRNTVRVLEDLIERGVTAEELTRRMYTPDTRVAGGASPPRVGLEAEMRSIAAFLDSLAPPGQRNCRFSLIEPMTVSESVAAAFVDLTCRGQNATSNEPDQQYHILYVWKKTVEGWRVSLEMF